MEKKPLWVVASTSLICALILGLGIWSSAAKKEVQPHRLTILFTGDDLGSAKPCG